MKTYVMVCLTLLVSCRSKRVSGCPNRQSLDTPTRLQSIQRDKLEATSTYNTLAMGTSRNAFGATTHQQSKTDHHLFVTSSVIGVPLEPLKINSPKGTPIKGKHWPIGPGSDKGMYNLGYFEGDIQLSEMPNGKNAITDPALLWPYATIIYKVDDDVGCPESPQCDILMKAMDHYHTKTCIRFKEWSGEDNFVQIFFNTGDSGACWSPVGRVGNGVQRLSLGQRCWYLGIVIHELGHSAGFWHEMNRPDRDDWIYIYWANIIPNFAHAFAKHDAKSVNSLGESFDYKSIMMYDEYAFSKDGISPTLQAKTGYEIGPIWKKPGLSNSDIRRVKKLYSCDGSNTKDGFPYDVICTFNGHTCGFKNGGSSVWNWRTVNDTDGYVYSSYENAGSTPGYLMSINFHPLPETDKSRGPLGCVRFWYLIQSDSGATLKLSQAYLDKVTQVSNDPETTFELWGNETSLNQWVHNEVPLYVTRPFRLIFESEFASENKMGTIALDDVELLYVECTGDTNTVSSVGTSLETSTTSERPLATTSITALSTMPNLFETNFDHENPITEPLQLIRDY